MAKKVETLSTGELVLGKIVKIHPSMKRETDTGESAFIGKVGDVLAQTSKGKIFVATADQLKGKKPPQLQIDDSASSAGAM